MKANRFKRSITCVYLHKVISRWALCTLILSGALLTACQTGSVHSDTILVEAPKAADAKREELPIRRRLSSRTAAHDSVVPQPVSTLPPPTENLTEQVGRRLGTTFDVNMAGGSLVIRKSSMRLAGPSLFEEAIILAKLRAFLKSSPLAEAKPSVTFQNGKAALILPSAVNSGTASVLIAKMLALDGVNEVSTCFDGRSRSFQESR